MAKILVVDDSAFTRRMIIHALEPGGYEIVEAQSGQEGLAAILQQTPDCIVLDLLMPGMSGVEFLRRLRNSGSNLPVVVVSADVQETVRTECLELGAASFLNKPPKDSEVLRSVQEAVTSGQGAVS